MRAKVEDARAVAVQYLHQTHLREASARFAHDLTVDLQGLGERALRRKMRADLVGSQS